MRISSSFWLFAIVLISVGCEKKPEKEIVYEEKIVYVEVPASSAEEDDEGETTGSETTGSETTGGSSGGDDSSLTDGEDNGGSELELTDIAMTGSLAISTAEAGRPFAGRSFERNTVDTYSLYCTTFEDEPAACSVAADATGKLSGNCKNFAGKSFGCFLRQESTTLTTVEFDGDSSVLAGAGQISTAIVYDAGTKQAIATVDMENSTALNAEAIESAKNAAGTATTVVPDLSGEWLLECQDDNDVGFGCEGHQMPPYLYLSQFAPESGPKRLAIWESKEARDECVGSGTEASPDFSVKLGTTTFGMNFSSKSALTTSLDSAFAGMSADVKKALVNTVKWDSRFETLNCAFNPVKVGNCKLVTLIDIEENGWDGLKYPDLSDVSGQSANMEVKTLTCTDDHAKAKNMPLCPPFVSVTDGFGSIKEVFLNNQPIFLACNTGQPHLFAHPTSDKDLNTAIAAESGGSECGTVGAGQYTGMLEIEREWTRELVMEMARQATFPNFLDSGVCAPYDPPPGFNNFNDCATNAAYEVCVKANEVRNAFGLNISGGGKLVPGAGPVEVPPEDTSIICPVARTGFFDGTHGDIPTFGTACKAEFGALTFGEQISRITANALAKDHKPILETIGCSISNKTERDSFFAGLEEASCMPDVYLAEICDAEGRCKRGLRCQGSSEPGGKCYDQHGVFVCNLFSRMDLMKLKPRVNGAFELSNSFVDTWHKHDDTGGVKECRFGVTTALNSRLASETEFGGVFQQTHFDSCADDFAFADAQTGENDFIRDQIMRLKFTKCASANCADEL